MDKALAARRLIEAAIIEAEAEGRTAEVRELCVALRQLWRVGYRRLGAFPVENSDLLAAILTERNEAK